MASFLENKEFAAMTIILLVLSILCRFITGIFLNSLIRETESMSTTQNRFLRQCKAKFKSCYNLNDGVPNIPVFVDRLMGKLQIGRFSVDGLAHLSGQLTLLAVFTSGLGACAAIMEGKAPGKILPYYLLSFLGLYLYFSISGLVDLEGKKALLKASLTDFLENHMAPRLAVLEESERLAGGPDGKEEAAAAFAFSGRAAAGKAEAPSEHIPVQEAAGKSADEKRMEEQVFSKSQEKELEELLKEFFA